MIRWAKKADINKIKKMVDSFEGDIDTFTKKYYERIIKEGILLVAEENKKLVGVCFGNYKTKEKWADLLGVVVIPEFRKKGIASSLIKEFESFVKKNKLKTIYLYADKKEKKLFKKLQYKQGKTYVSFTKKF